GGIAQGQRLVLGGGPPGRTLPQAESANAQLLRAAETVARPQDEEGRVLFVQQVNGARARHHHARADVADLLHDVLELHDGTDGVADFQQRLGDATVMCEDVYG